MVATLSPSARKGAPVNSRVLENDILPTVFKPGRYMGLESGTYRKPFHHAKATLAFAFPDLYEIGISNYGIKLLYSIVNQHPDYLCDRVYAAAPDMQKELAKHNMPLFGVESRVPIKDFDLLAFSLQYELNYTTILGALEAAQIPFRAKDRDSMDWPILIAGGPGSGNPMSVAPFFDAFIIGDGEEILIELLDVMAEARKEGWTKDQVMEAFVAIEGTYVPGRTTKAYKRIVDIAKTNVDIAPLVPTVAAIHDRVVVEARRGCDRMCRFCQPGFINLPTREQSVENINKKLLEELDKTGYEECSLLSLSIADYSHFKPLVMNVTDTLKETGASLSLSSQRADRFSVEVADAVSSVRKSTLTFAPEAGTPRMRDVINKNLSDEEILSAVTKAYTSGWNKVKLYFMIGLPTETNDDLDGIVSIVARMQQACRAIKRDAAVSKKHNLEVNVTISNFVPKPHTPFQWFPQDSMPMLTEKIDYLKEKFRPFRGIKVNYTDPEISKLEAVISKAGPELADVVEAAYKKGAYLDAWDDLSAFDKWFEALHELGYNEETYTRERLVSLDDALPWDVIEMGLTKSWMQEEYKRATEAASTTPCFETCSTCGVCATYSTWPTFIETAPTVDGDEKAKRLKITKEAKVPVPFEIGRDQKPPPVGRVRLTATKTGDLRFISHLDWMRLLQRAIKRSGIPVSYSQGFHPKPKISVTPALPLFMESYGEMVELDLSEATTDVMAKLNQYLPPQCHIVDEEYRPMSDKKLSKSIVGIEYRATWKEGSDSGSTPSGACQEGRLQGKMPTSLIARIRALNDVLTGKAEETMPAPLMVRMSDEDSSKDFDLIPYLSALSLETPTTGPERLRFMLSRPASLPAQPPGTTPVDVYSIKATRALAALEANADPVSNNWHIARMATIVT